MKVPSSAEHPTIDFKAQRLQYGYKFQNHAYSLLCKDYAHKSHFLIDHPTVLEQISISF